MLSGFPVLVGRVGRVFEVDGGSVGGGLVVGGVGVVDVGRGVGDGDGGT